MAVVVAAVVAGYRTVVVHIPAAAAVAVVVEIPQTLPQNSALMDLQEADHIHSQIHPAARKHLDQASFP